MSNEHLKYGLTGPKKMTEAGVLENPLFPPLPVFHAQVCVKNGRGDNEAEAIIAIINGFII